MPFIQHVKWEKNRFIKNIKREKKLIIKRIMIIIFITILGLILRHVYYVHTLREKELINNSYKMLPPVTFHMNYLPPWRTSKKELLYKYNYNPFSNFDYNKTSEKNTFIDINHRQKNMVKLNDNGEMYQTTVSNKYTDLNNDRIVSTVNSYGHFLDFDFWKFSVWGDFYANDEKREGYEFYGFNYNYTIADKLGAVHHIPVEEIENQHWDYLYPDYPNDYFDIFDISIIDDDWEINYSFIMGSIAGEIKLTKTGNQIIEEIITTNQLLEPRN